MQKNSSSTSVIVFIVILIIGGLMYLYTLGNPSDSSISSIEGQGMIGNADSQIIGNRVLALLNEISKLKIDKSVFDSPMFKMLQDHTVDIPVQNVGRANPFEPFYAPYVPPSSTSTRNR